MRSAYDPTAKSRTIAAIQCGPDSCRLLLLGDQPRATGRRQLTAITLSTVETGLIKYNHRVERTTLINALHRLNNNNNNKLNHWRSCSWRKETTDGAALKYSL